MNATERVPAPVMDSRKLQAQREVLMRYIQERRLLQMHQSYEYITHEYVSRPNHPTMVRVDIRVFDASFMAGNRETSFEFSLQELQHFQEGGEVGGFPLGRTRPTHLDGVRLPTQASPAASVAQSTWSNRREAVFSQAANIQEEARRFVSRQINGGAWQMNCRCLANREYMCSHLQFVYASGWDRGMLFDESGVGKSRNIRLPIGMGKVYLAVVADILEDDERPAGKRRTGFIEIHDERGSTERPLVKMAEANSPFPDDISRITLMPGEGSIKAIRYIENLLRGTAAYQNLLQIDVSGNLYDAANAICRRTHMGSSGQRLVAQFLAGLRLNNEHRENWMLACAYTILIHGLCLPCNEATTGSANIPTA